MLCLPCLAWPDCLPACMLFCLSARLPACLLFYACLSICLLCLHCMPAVPACLVVCLPALLACCVRPACQSTCLHVLLVCCFMHACLPAYSACIACLPAFLPAITLPSGLTLWTISKPSMKCFYFQVALLMVTLDSSSNHN